MQFAYREWSVLLVLAAALAAMAVVGLWRKRRALRQLAGTSATPVVLVRRWVQFARAALILVIATLLGVVLLGPQWGFAEEEPAPVRGRDVLFILDVSRSMLAEDVAPNRLARAKADIRDLVAALERAGGYRVGLITFAERAALLCPLTTDYRCFEEELARASLETLRLRGDPGVDDGTQLSYALRRAELAIDPETAKYTDILLLSDGDDMATQTLAAADALARLGVAVHTLGLGNPGEGALIPVRGPDGRMTHLRYKGELVRTKLEEAVLRSIAERTHGRYLAAGTGYLELDRAFAAILADKESRELQTKGQTRLGIHRFQWFLAPVVLLLLLEFFLVDARRTPPKPSGKPTYFRWVRRRGNALSAS
jgi:Ca-activated chloride channel family protein